MLKVHHQNIILRFSGFDDKWKNVKLGDILTFYPTNSFSREKLNYDSGTVKNIHYGDIHTKFPTILSVHNNNDIPYINQDIDLTKFKKEQYLQDGDLIIADASEDYADIGKAIEVRDINDEKVVAGLHTLLARDEKGITLNGFKGYLFLTETLKKKIKVIANGVSVLGISSKDLSELTAFIPSKHEQQNIVNFMFNIDKKIELLENKYKYCQNFKKYLMQQIFAQKLRFKDDGNKLYQDWELLHLKDIISLNGGYAFKSELFKDEGIPIIRISNISQDNSVILNDLVYYDKIENDQDFIIKKGELIIAMSGATTGKVAVYDSEQLSYINQRVGLFKPISNKLYYPFLVQYTLSDSFKKELQKTLVAGAQPNISKKEIESFKINLPCYDEQKKIADLLTNIDLKIDTLRKQTVEVSEFKKSLLQQMFNYMRVSYKFNKNQRIIMSSIVTNRIFGGDFQFHL